VGGKALECHPNNLGLSPSLLFDGIPRDMSRKRNGAEELSDETIVDEISSAEGADCHCRIRLPGAFAHCQACRKETKR
jgi:hypothetical protein